MNPSDGQTWGPIIGIGIAALVLAIRMKRGMKPRPISLIWMWIIPIVLLCVLAMVLSLSPLHGLDWLWLLAGLAIGGALGWQRGRMMTITIDPQTGKPMAQASPAALLFILGLMAVRMALRQVGETQASNWHVDPMVITDAFLAMAVGLLAAQRIEMFVRARRLIEDARGVGKIVS